MTGTISLSVVYGIVAVISLLLAVGYCGLARKKELTLLLIHFAVFVVNLGYFVLSISRTLEEALLANRIAYFGSVFLPLFMFWAILNVCEINFPKCMMGILLTVSIGTFLLAASGGYLDVYYKEVSLVYVNGAAKLVKEYGPLHGLYLVYLLSYFGLMVGAILYTLLKKKDVSPKVAVFLAAIVLGNVGIWFVEQLIPGDFEFLSVSYVLMVMLLSLVYSMLYDGKMKVNTALEQEKCFIAEIAAGSEPETEKCLIEDEVHESVIKTEVEFKRSEKDYWQEICQEIAYLTERELEVFSLIMKNKKRKDIADELNVSENTVKKHTSHIFAKLCVTNRMELFEKMKK